MLHRPEPILRHSARPIDRIAPAGPVAKMLLDGRSLIVSDHYGTGAEILDRLYDLMRPPPPDAPYRARRAFRVAFREAAMRLLAPIDNHRVALAGGEHNGFLKELYPELSRFALPFVQVQELHGAWAQYDAGVHLAVLGYRLHPFYGTYVPTRTPHLELFGTWLSQHQGARGSAVDMGTGCGVLALMLCKAGFQDVVATDINPNAVESVSRELERRPERPPITLSSGDLFGSHDAPVDLIVFNPPWTRGPTDSLIDGALFFGDGLFERFFDQAADRLNPGGRIAVLFSNIITLMQPDEPHPLLAELERGRFQLVQKIQRRVKPTRDARGRMRKTKERVEVWELAKA